MANKNVKLKNKNGDYLYPYTDNIPTASTSTAGKVRLDSSPTSGSNNAITSGAVHTALSSKADDSAVAHKTGAETFTGNKTLQASNDDAWLIKKANGDYTDVAPTIQVAGAFRVTDKNEKIMGDVRFIRTTAGLQTATLVARNAASGSEKSCTISCNVDKDGNVYTSAPTPVSSDNSTKIATTAWVTSKVSSATTAGLSECHVVVTKYRSGTNWYRVWSDGWIEQGGYLKVDSNGQLLTFLKPFSDVNYTMTAAGTEQRFGNVAFYERTTASTKCWTSDDESFNAAGMNWYACGY